MEQHIGVRTPGFFEGRQSVESAILVDGGRDGLDGGRKSSGVGDDGTEGFAEDVKNQPCNLTSLFDCGVNMLWPYT